MNPLKLIALDHEDLEVISCHVQDAFVTVGEIVWLPAERRLVIPLNRFDWERADSPTPEVNRRRSVLRFECVNAFKARGVDQDGKDAMLNLLAVNFAEQQAPSGTIELTFSGGPALRLEVECVEAELADLGPAVAAEGVHRRG
jgi:hypothetical protein